MDGIKIIDNKVTYITRNENSIILHLNNETNDLLKNIGLELVLNKIHNRYVPVKICPESFVMRRLYENDIDVLHAKFKEMSDSDVRHFVKSNLGIKKFNM